MGIFNKKEKKLRQEFSKKNISLCKEVLKETQEVYEDITSACDNIDTIVSEFTTYLEELSGKLSKEDEAALEEFSNKLHKVNRFGTNIVRDVRDLIRNHKKRLKESIANK